MEFQRLYPEFLVTDISRSTSFYCKIIGFQIEYERPEENFALISLERAQIMLLQDNSSPHSRTAELEYPRGRGVNISIQTSNLSNIEASLKSINHDLRIPVRDQWHRQDNILHGERQLWVMDPDGYLLRFIESLGTRRV